jgi:hypothetical protein
MLNLARVLLRGGKIGGIRLSSYVDIQAAGLGENWKTTLAVLRIHFYFLKQKRSRKG